MISILLHGVATGLFLLLAYLYPRYPVSGWLQKDSWINVTTGLGGFLIAKPVVMLIQNSTTFHLFALPFESDVLRFLAPRLPRNPSRLMSLVHLIDQESLRDQRKITIPWLKRFLSPKR